MSATEPSMERPSARLRRRFPLLQYFSATSLICTIIAAVALGVLYRQNAVAELMAQAERESTGFAREVAATLQAEIAQLLNPSASTAAKAGVMERIDDMVRSEAGFHGAAKAKIYSVEGLTLYSTYQAEIGRIARDNPGVAGALAGTVTSNLVHRDQFNAFDQVIENRDLLQTYLPIAGSAAGEVIGVFELYSDMTDLLARIRATERVVVAGVAGTLLLLYGLLFLIVYKADRIIKRQDETLQGQVREIDRYSVVLEDRVRERTDDLQAAYGRLSAEVSEREAAQKELELARQRVWQQDKLAAIGRLAAGIVHEIGNPLAAVSGLVDVAHGELSDHKLEAADQCLHQIKDQLQRLVRITRDVSGFSVPEVRAPEVLDLNELLSRVITVLRYDVKLSTILIRLELDRGLPAIGGVPDQLWQVIMNLVLNAADAIARRKNADPTITVTTTRRNGDAVLCVRDQGEGMSPEVLAKAFEPFQTTKAPGEGMGIGLSLCYAIVRQHGGDISIASRPQMGTTVSVTLPLADARAD